VSAPAAVRPREWAVPLTGAWWRRPGHLVERSALVYRRSWMLVLSGFFEPVFYLLSIGVGISKLVGDVVGPGGHVLDYTSFLAPALLATSAMNGAVYESTGNVFAKLKWQKTYDAILATPVGPRDIALGEIAWALLRGLAYAAAFLLVMVGMGLVHSWWAIAAVPAALLVGFAFAACGFAATTFMRSWQDFEFVQLVVLPLALLSATYYPLSTYPRGLQIVVELTPLYHGVALERAFTTGAVGADVVVHVAYLAGMGAVGLAISSRRLGRLLLP
jgi:lipooligosaccharide transport system permease protein